MSKRYLVFSIICWVIMLITVVCWIVTYYGLFTMDLQQSMLYIGFNKIEICDGWNVDDIPKYLSESLQRVIHNQHAPLISWFDFSKFDDQVRNSLALFHLGYALITALSLAGGITFTVLFIKKKKSQ